MNLGVKALLSWTKATIAATGSSETDIVLEDLQNGEILLKLVYFLRKDSSPCLSDCTEDRFKSIADFVERDCRFNECNGTSISWRDILDGRNLTTEISKILLLLVYHDLMNEHCTLGNIDSDTESQIAILTETYVMESEGRVSLKPGLDAHLSRRYLITNPFDLNKSMSITSSSSSVSSYDEDGSPVFVRSQKVKFVDLDNVASSSVSSSPIQNIMNTPKFQLRKLQRQMIEDREYRDGLEKELGQKLELLAQKESQINRLQYFLDKLKKEQGVHEQIAKDQLEQLENKNNQLQSSFSDVLKQNRAIKDDAALTERQVDKLTEENGELSSQMRSVRAKLAVFQAENDRLRETKDTNEEEWRTTICNLKTELNDARAEKGDLVEQIEILKGRISCLEDQISRSIQQEEGENLWTSVEKVILEKKICALTDELDNTTNSLRKTEVEVLTKTQQLKDCEKEISDHKVLQKEMADVREALQQEISTLKICLEKAEQEKCEQTKRQQLQLASCAQEIEKLKEIKQQKEDSLFQIEEKIKDLMTKLCAANDLLADKEKEVCSLTEKVDSLVIMHQQAKDEAQAKDEMFSQLLVEKSQKEEVFQSNIQLLKDQVNSLRSSLKEAEDLLQNEKNLFSQTHKEKCEQIEMLHHDIIVCKKTIETLKNEIQVKDDQLMEIKNENSRLSESMQEEIHALKGQVNDLCKSLMEAKQQVETLQTELTKREEENSHQRALLQQQLCSSEEMVKSLKDEIKTKADQMSLLENQSLEQSELLKTKINDSQHQLKSLQSQLKKTQEVLCLRENEFALKLQEMEAAQTKVARVQDELQTLHSNLQTKEEEFSQLKRDTSIEMDHLKAENLKQSQALENDIKCLHSQVQSLNESLNSATQQLQVKEQMLARKEMEIQNLKTTLENEINALKQQMHDNEEQMITLKNESASESNLNKQEKLSLKNQLDDMAVLLSKAEDKVQTQLQMLTEQELKTAQEQELLQKKLADSQDIVRQLEDKIHDKEHQMAELKSYGFEQSRDLMEKNECLQRQLESLSASLKDTEDKMHFKESLLTQQQQENKLKQQELCDLQAKMEQVEKQMLSFKQENNQLQVALSAKDVILEKSQEQCQTVERELSAVKIKIDESNKNVFKLREDAVAQAELIHKAKEDIQNKDNMLNELKDQVSQNIKQLEDCSQKLVAKEEQLLKTQLAASQQIENLSQQLFARKTELNQRGELHSQVLRKNEEMLAQQQQENKLKQQELCDLQVKMEQVENQMLSFKQENNQLQVDLTAKDVIFEKSQDQCQTLERELSAAKIKMTENDENVLKLREAAVAQAELIHKAKEDIQNKDNMLNELKEQNSQKVNSLEQCVETLKGQLENCSQKLVVKEEQLLKIQLESSQQIDSLNHELVILNTELNQREELNTQVLRNNEEMLAQQQQENKLKQQELCDLQVKMEKSEKQMLSFKQENNNMQVDLTAKDALLEKAQEQCQTLERELSAVKIKMDESNKNVLQLREDAVAQAELIHKAKEDIQNKDNMLNELKEQASQNVKQLEHCSQKLVSKEEQLLKIQLESSQQIENLKQELVTLHTELNQREELHTQVLRKNEEMLDSTKRERDDLVKEKGTLNSKLELLGFENQKLAQAKQVLERENNVAQNLHSKLQQDLQMLKQDNEDLLKDKIKMEDIETTKKDLHQQLEAKSTAAEHYKAQMEKAVSHYNSKKQLLQQSEEVVANLKQSLEVQEHEAKTASMENKILQMELDKIQNNEKLLLNKIASLEAQLSFADKALREQNKIPSRAFNVALPSQRYGMQTKTRSISSDSLEQSSADDSLNTTRKLSAPSESSTPLVRSSERLAAKRQDLKAESLETLYFTPINTRHRATTDSRPEESVKKNSASSVKRRRTTQKTPGRDEAESFYSLTSARSHPNLCAQGISTELFATPAKVTGSDTDQLIGLPGYRRSTIHSQSTSTFCVGAENEPEGGPEDWMRIAEIQARNKACLPHLKSSYPLEFDAVRNSALTFTDEELRTGDPIETIRRVSMMPGQLQDSLQSHRLSYMMGASGTAATARSRLSLMPGQDFPVSSTVRSPKGTKRPPSTLTVHPTSPEKKVRASCFPRPLTPKNKNVALSPADRRQSMMFTIDNTPRKDLLKKGLNKLRSSTRKSPGRNLKSPAQPSHHRNQENIPAKNSRAAIGGAGRLGSQKSPAGTSKGLKKSGQASARAAKSPGLTASARKKL